MGSSTSASDARTDWTAYYKEEKLPPFILNAMSKHILDCILRFVDCSGELSIAELGGAGTLIYERLKPAVPIAEYHVLDSNEFGLAHTREKYPDDPRLHTHFVDLLDDAIYRNPLKADLVMSFGLVEHFAPAETARCIDAHFALTKPGGTVIISFPTPTPIYRTVRGLMELANRWDFPDERPLTMAEVGPVLGRNGDLLEHHKIWATLVTQLITVTRVAP
jgi:hypothetical protein